MAAWNPVIRSRASLVTMGLRVKAGGVASLLHVHKPRFHARYRQPFPGGLLRGDADVLACRAMATQALDAALDRLEQALARVEGAAAQQGNLGTAAGEELALLKVRHRRLKDTVAQELRQLDLLLAGLPK